MKLTPFMCIFMSFLYTQKKQPVLDCHGSFIYIVLKYVFHSIFTFFLLQNRLKSKGYYVINDHLLLLFIFEYAEKLRLFTNIYKRLTTPFFDIP